MKIIEFPNKRKDVTEDNKKEAIKETAHWIIDKAKDDFMIVLKAKDVGHLFDGVTEEDKYIVGMSDRSNKEMLRIILRKQKRFDLGE